MPSYRSRLPLTLRVRVSLHAVLSVAARPWAMGLGLAASVIILGILLWLPNFGLLLSTLSDSHMTAAVRLHFATSVFGSLFVNNSAVGGLVLITFALLSGINLAVLAFVVSGSFRQAVSGGSSQFGRHCVRVGGSWVRGLRHIVFGAADRWHCGHCQHYAH